MDTQLSKGISAAGTFGLLTSGADFGGGKRPGPPNFTYNNFLESYICPYDNTYSSYMDL